MKKITILISLFISTTTFALPTYHVEKYTSKHAKGFDRSIPIPVMKWKSHSNEQSIPGSADISSMVSLPEDQGACGACWDFSLTKALRSEYMVNGSDPGVLEFNYLLNNCGPGPAMGGCNGGSFAAAASFLKGAGPGLNSVNPYTGRDGGKCFSQPVAATAVEYTMLGTNGVNPTFQDLAYAVGVEKHMVSIDVAASSGDWENYSNGIYNGCTGNASDIDHMIDVVGYDCQTSVDSNGLCVFDANGRPINGDGFLIVENNWGENWGTTAANGHGGYMKTVMYGADGSNCNAIANDALVFDANSNTSKKAKV